MQMNWVSLIDFILSAFNFGLMIFSISIGSWAFIVNLWGGALCLYLGIIALEQ